MMSLSLIENYRMCYKIWAVKGWLIEEKRLSLSLYRRLIILIFRELF